MIQIDILRAPQAWLVVLVGLAVLVYRKLRHGKSVQNQLYNSLEPGAKNMEYSKDAYYQLTPLADLDLEKTEPEKLRPFKPKYYLTMAIQNIAFDDLVAMDKTFTERIRLRKHLLETRPQDVLASKPVVAPAVTEFYSWMVKIYLPNRFPTVYSPTSSGLLNTVTGETLTLNPSTTDEALRILGENVDTDFLFLLPIPASEGGEDVGKYRLEGFITCFPSGFRTAKKLGLKLADIHGPVPNYKTRLELPMDRFFANMPNYRIIKRHNWSITTTRELCLMGGTHSTAEELAKLEAGETPELDIDQTVLRCERQTLHRLPESGALVFGYKTYQYGMRELRDEGVGKELVDAAEGLEKGNAPGFGRYKRQIVWGKKVSAFLRGEIDC